MQDYRIKLTGLILLLILFFPQMSPGQVVTRVAADSLEFEIAQNAIKIFGDYTVQKGMTLSENVHVIGGNVYVEGTVDQHAQITVYGGDVYVEKDGVVKGQIICLGGKVINRSGRDIEGGIFEANLGGLTLKRKEIKPEEDESPGKVRRRKHVKSSDLVHSPHYYEKGNHIRYNPVEGVYFQFPIDKRIYDFPNVHFILNIGYGFAMDDWRTRLTIEKYLWKRNPMTIYASGFRATETKDSWLITDWENSLAAFFFHENFMNFYETTGFYFGVTQRFFNAIQYMIQYNSEDQKSLENNTDWSLFYSEHTFPDNEPIDDGLLNSILLSLRFGNHWASKPALSGFTILLSAEVSDTSYKSDFQFKRFIADSRLYLPIGDYIIFRNRFRIGSAEGHLPLQKQFAMGGIGSVRGYPYYSLIHPLGGNRMALANVEFAIFSDISDDDAFFIFFDTGNVWHEDEDSDFLQGFADLPDILVSSAGLGFGEVDDGVRIDFAKRLDYSGKKAWSVSLRWTLPF